MTTSINFRSLTISAGEGRRELDQELGGHRRIYTVYVKSDGTGVTRWFRFGDSIANERAGRVGIAGDDLLWAFRCFVSDAEAGAMTWADFAADFGYDLDSYSARETHKECKKAARKFADLWHGVVETGDVLEELSEMGIE